MSNIRKYFSIIVIGVWFFSLILLLPRHELWYEEAHGWLFARDSNSLVSLYQNLTYEAHPIMWYVILFGITRLTSDFYYMQLAHLIIALIGVVIFYRYAPFRLIDKVLFVFGYFIFFEYTVISRNYGLTVVFLFIYCATYAQRFKHLWLSALLAGLLAQTSPVGFLFSLVIGCFLFGEYCWEHKRMLAWRTLAISLICFGLLVGTAMFKLLPPADRSYTLDSFTSFDLQRVALSGLMIWRGMVPIPHGGMHFWNTNIALPAQGTTVLSAPQYGMAGFALILVLLFILYSCLLFAKKRVLLGIYLGSAGVLFLLFYTTYYGAIRHYGFFFILFVSVLWLGKYYVEEGELFPNRVKSLYTRAWNIFPWLFTGLLAVHFICGWYVYFMDYVKPFMTSRNVADYMKSSGQDKMQISVDYDYAMTPMSIYLNKSLYYPRSDTFGTYVVMNSMRQPINQDEIVRRSLTRFESEGILLLNYPLSNVLCLELKKVFEESLAYQDTVYIYYASTDCLDSRRSQ